MSRNKNIKTSVTYQTICLDKCVVPVQLTVIQRLQQPEQLMNDEQVNEINSFLQNIAEEVASGQKVEIGRIYKLDGKYVKFAYCITKSNESEQLSLLVPQKSQVSEEMKLRRVPACDYSIKASVYSLPNVEKPEQPKAQGRVEILKDIFASVQAESPLQTPQEVILHEAILKLEDKKNVQIIIDECNETRSESAEVSDTNIEKSRGFRLFLTEVEISSQFEKWKGDLMKIAKGKVTCKRHGDYKKGGPTKRNLDHQLYLSAFDERQIEWALNCLKSMFTTKNTCDIAEPKEMDYIFRVLLPEFLARICMEIENVSYDEAENKLKFEYTRDP